MFQRINAGPHNRTGMQGNPLEGKSLIRLIRNKRTITKFVKIDLQAEYKYSRQQYIFEGHGAIAARAHTGIRALRGITATLTLTCDGDSG